MSEYYKTFEEFCDELLGKVNDDIDTLKDCKEYARYKKLNALVSEEGYNRFNGLWYLKNRPTVEKIISFAIAYTLYCQKRLDENKLNNN